MPIRESQRKRYPPNWKDISDRIRFKRACGKCECEGVCGDTHFDENGDYARCNAPHMEWIFRSKLEPERWWLTHALMPRGAKPIKVVLTVAHLDHTPENCEDHNLLAMCQRCHLKHDGELHAKTARTTRHARKAGRDLFD